MVTTRKTIAENIAVYNVMALHAHEFQAAFKNPHLTEDELLKIYDRYLGTISRMRYQFPTRDEYLKCGLSLELNHDLIKKIISHYMEILHANQTTKIAAHKNNAVLLLQIVIDETDFSIQYYQNILQNLDNEQHQPPVAKSKHEEPMQQRILLQDLQNLYRTLNEICQMACKNYQSQSHNKADVRRHCMNQWLNLTVKLTIGKVLIDVQDLKDLVNLYIDDFLYDKNKKRTEKSKRLFSRNDFFRMGLNPKFQYTFFLSTLFNVITEFQHQKVEVELGTTNRKSNDE